MPCSEWRRGFQSATPPWSVPRCGRGRGDVSSPTWRYETFEESDRAKPEMTTFSDSRRWAHVSAGAVLLCLAWVLCAPADARAGCSHLVTSRTNRALLSSFLQDEVLYPGDAAATPSLPRSMPGSPSPCRGAWCSGGPTVPALPAATLSIRAPLWAWCESMPGPTSTSPSRLIEETADFRPLHRVIAVFHPPRRFSLA